MTKRGHHNDVGMHTEYVAHTGLVGQPIRVVDSHHAFAKRLRGEPGQYLCLTCGKGRTDPTHQKVKRNTGLTHTGRTTCLDCGTTIRKTSIRCFPCSQKRITQKAERAKAVHKAKTEAARREEMK